MTNVASIPQLSTTPTGRLPYAVAAAPCSAGALAPACPDGITFCLGDPDTHGDPREHIHHGPAHSMSGTFGKSLVEFSLVQWHDGKPELEFVGDGQWDTLNLDQADELIGAEAAHLAKLHETRAHLAKLLGGQPEESAPVAAGGHGRATSAEVAAVHARAPWCEVTEHDTTRFRADVACYRYGTGVTLPVFFPGDPEQTGGEVLRAVLDVRPYDENPARHEPVVNLEVIEDHWIEDLDPDALADVIAKLRGHLDELDQVHARLVQARADWSVQA